MANETWKPPLPKTNPELSATFQSLSQWLKVPWTTVFNCSYNHSTTTGTPHAVVNASTTMQFRKLREGSRIHIQANGSAYSGGVGEYVQFYFNLSSSSFAAANYSANFQYFNVANSHMRNSGSAMMDSLPAGVYTLALYWGVVGTIYIDSNDPWNFVVTETNEAPSL